MFRLLILTVAVVLGVAACSPVQNASGNAYELRPLLPTGVETLRGHVDARSAKQMLDSDAPFFRAPPLGGWADYANTISLNANLRGKTLVLDGPVASASVVIARTVRQVVVTDPTAPWLGVHHPIAHAPGATDLSLENNMATGVVDLTRSRVYFSMIGAPACFDFYQRQPQSATNEVVYLSWDQVEENCQ